MPTRTWRGNTYRFTVTSATAAAGDTYTNNGQIFTVTDSITAGTVLYCTGTGAPSAAPGNLVRATGAGTNPIAYSAFTSPNTNWGTTTNWLENAVPTSADDVIFDANSGNCNLNVNGVCRSFDANTYGAKTWSLNTNSINVGTGIFRLGAGMTVTGNGTFVRNTNAAGTMTMTSNGVVWPGNVTFALNAAGMSWADNWTILGNFLFGGFANVTGTATITIGGSLTNAGGISAGPSSTATYVLNGTGTLDGNFGMLIVINTSGVITLPTSLRPSSLNYITGNVIVNSGHTYIMANGSSHLTDRTSTGGSKINFFNLTGFQSGTVTLLSNLTVTNNYTNNVNVTFAGGFTIFIAGNLLSSGAILNPSLTKTTLELNGPTSSTLQSTALNPAIYTNLIINKSAGATVTFLSNILFGDATFPNSILQLTAGFVNPGSFTVTNSAGCVINNMTLNNLTVGATITQNTANTINGTLLLNGNTTFTGTAGWTTNNFTHGGAGTTCTLQAGITYNVTGLFTMIGTAGQRAVLQSNDAQNVQVTINALSNQMVLNTGTIPNPSTGYVLGSRAFTGVLPTVLNDLLPNRPTILSGTANPYTLTAPIGGTAVPSSLLLQLGKKAFFNVATGTGSTFVAYAATRDIDSSGGIEIQAAQSYSDAIGQPSPNLFRTINWGPLIAPSSSTYYTWIK